MSESKSNATRHGLKEDDIVGILDSDYLGRVGRITHIGTGVFAGKCVVLVNGEGLWIDADLLCKISRRGCFRRTKPRRKTVNAKHEANSGTSGAIRRGDPRLDPGYYAPTVGTGAGSEPQPEAPKAEPKFKIGDRIEVCEGHAAGATGEVVYVSRQDDMLAVISDDESSFSWLPTSFHRHAPAEPAPATESAPEQEKPKFRPFDKVLVRDDKAREWYPAFFSHYGEGKNTPYFVLEGGYIVGWRYCIPYEGNEALVGTTNEPEKG